MIRNAHPRPSQPHLPRWRDHGDDDNRAAVLRLALAALLALLALGAAGSLLAAT
jgi:hypothetical protein